MKRQAAGALVVVIGSVAGLVGIDTAASQTDVVLGDAVMAITCDVAFDEVRERQRAGGFDIDRRRDVDRESVVIDHQPVDDTVAADDERPTLDDFPSVDQVAVDDLDDRSLAGLMAVCRSTQR